MARLLHRLGPDAADPVEEFLSLAQEAERTAGLSLQGFLHERPIATWNLLADAFLSAGAGEVSRVKVGDMEEAVGALAVINERGLDGRLDVDHAAFVDVANVGRVGGAFGEEVFEMAVLCDRDAAFFAWRIVDDRSTCSRCISRPPRFASCRARVAYDQPCCRPVVRRRRSSRFPVSDQTWSVAKVAGDPHGSARLARSQETIIRPRRPRIFCCRTRPVPFCHDSADQPPLSSGDTF